MRSSNVQLKPMAASKSYDNPLTKGKPPKRGKHCHSVLKRRPYAITLLLWGLVQAAIVFTLILLAHILINSEFQHLPIIGISSAAAIAFQVAYLIARCSCRCPLCKGHHLRPGHSQKHRKAYRIKPFTHAYTSMITMYSTGTIRCMHCGTPFDVSKKIPVHKHPNRRK